MNPLCAACRPALTARSVCGPALTARSVCMSARADCSLCVSARADRRLLAACQSLVEGLLQPRVELRLGAGAAGRHAWLRRPGLVLRAHPLPPLPPPAQDEVGFRQSFFYPEPKRVKSLTSVCRKRLS